MSSATVSSRAAGAGHHWVATTAVVFMASVLSAGAGWVAGAGRLLPLNLRGSSPANLNHDHDPGTRDSHAGHDHGHAGHNDENSLVLSEQARKNIGLTIAPIKLQEFERTIAI